MAKVIPIGEPVNEAERRTIAHLRDNLPDSYLVLHNFEVERDGELFEVDLAVITPHAVYLVDTKGTRGLIDVYGTKWYPEGRQPFTSPLIKLRGHARSLKGIITASQPGRRELNDIYVDAAIVLAAPDAVLQDPGGRDDPRVTTLRKATAFFQNSATVPAKYSRNISRMQGMVLKAVQGVARKPSGPLRFGNWEVDERIAATDTCTEYRAYNAIAGARSGRVLLRVYEADPYLPDEERKKQRARIANAYNALNKMPAHSGIIGVRDFSANEQEDRYTLVTEDIPGQALRLHIDKPNLALTVDQKLRVAEDLLEALAHAHHYEVVHRNLTPSTILLGSDGHLRIVGFDFARSGTDRTLTIAHEIVDELEPSYQAPEAYREPQNASPASDVFSAGVVLYELFTGEKPFTSQTEVFDLSGVFPAKPSDVREELPTGFDGWLQNICSFDPDHRPSARAAALELAGLLTPPSDAQPDLGAPEFIESYLAKHGGELRPLIRALANEETEWLELKAALIPPPDRDGANENDGRWAVTKAAVALANSIGGAVLLGVDDAGRPASLSHSDPKGYLDKDGWDVFARKVIDSGLFRDGGWKTATRGTWRLDVATFKTHVRTLRATLDGQPVVVLLVTPVAPRGPLLEATNTNGSKVDTTLFVRRRGDVGVVDKLEGQPSVEAWLNNRRLTSPLFRQLLEVAAEPAPDEPDTPEGPEIDYSRLSNGDNLTHKYVVQARLGRPGSFGVVYKVIDTLGDVTRAVKLILRDRHSTLERLKKEYRTLLRTPEHPRVVKVVDADLLPNGGPPFIVFEYIEGQDIGQMVEDGLFAPGDALELARHITEGLVHLHRHGVYHCDIKPRNLLWTNNGGRIIDFNVSVLAASDNGHGGGSRRYLPPDLDLTQVPRPSDLADRDLYALGLTLYEAVTGRYPWEDATTPPPGEPPQDPRDFSGLSDLAPEFVDVILKAISPKRADRFAAATGLASALANVRQARRPRSAESTSSGLRIVLDDDGTIPPNTNPYVNRLLTVYSQSKRTNAGTRGLDDIGQQTYVATSLDSELGPAVLGGEFRLVVITGNAGDGKTAFLQSLEKKAEDLLAVFDAPSPNGRRFTLQGRSFVTNYDGSQDEGDQTSHDVLREFLAPFSGVDATVWPSDEVRLIAINEGRLVDFLSSERSTLPLLEQVIARGLASGATESGVAVVNLNLRSVVTDPLGFEGDPRGDDSIFARLVRRMTHERFWEPCHGCDLKDRCYAFHNAKTFQDDTAGPKVIERLKTAYTLTHLRGRLHITLRDLRSALAYMLVGTRDCQEIHDLYRSGDREAIVQGFYFNSWMGGDAVNADRLLTLLKDVDVGSASDPRLDRTVDFVSPTVDQSLFGFDRRGSYDQEVLRRLFQDLPRDFSGRPSEHRAQAHRRYVALARRRAFFERRDPAWRQMLPYRSAEKMLDLVSGRVDPLALETELLPTILRAINRAEGLADPERLGGKLALQVREVDRGTVRSYRVFPTDRFSLRVVDTAGAARFVEHMPTGLVLRYEGAGGNHAELQVNLDVFEMLERLNNGYRPSVEEVQGYYLSLAVFKNLLGSEPYQEVLLTTTGHDFYRVERHTDGRLEMSELGMEAI